jgi:acyl-coenzyme A synthetase/AMP-(fatty) acid ligase
MDSGELVLSLKQKLQPYMVPQRVIALNHMPLNSSGKVDRKALTKMLTEAPPSAI